MDVYAVFVLMAVVPVGMLSSVQQIEGSASNQSTCPAATQTVQVFTSNPAQDIKGQSGCKETIALAREQLRLTSLILANLNVDTESASRPRDCAEILSAGNSSSGVYTVYPDVDGDPFRVFCDMDTDGEGWTVIQRRRDGSEDFYRYWSDYKNGFGDLTSEHWLGNEKLHRLTWNKKYRIRIDLADWAGNSRFAEYDRIMVGSEDLFYPLILGNYSGTAGDSLVNHQGNRFSTRDSDHDKDSGSCSQSWHAGWWYNRCHHANLNGLYRDGGSDFPKNDGITWYRWKGNDYSLKKTDIKIQPTN